MKKTAYCSLLTLYALLCAVQAPAAELGSVNFSAIAAVEIPAGDPSPAPAPEASGTYRSEEVYPLRLAALAGMRGCAERLRRAGQAVHEADVEKRPEGGYRFVIRHGAAGRRAEYTSPRYVSMTEAYARMKDAEASLAKAGMPVFEMGVAPIGELPAPSGRPYYAFWLIYMEGGAAKAAMPHPAAAFFGEYELKETVLGGCPATLTVAGGDFPASTQGSSVRISHPGADLGIPARIAAVNQGLQKDYLPGTPGYTVREAKCTDHRLYFQYGVPSGIPAKPVLAGTEFELYRYDGTEGLLALNLVKFNGYLKIRTLGCQYVRAGAVNR